MNVSVENSRHRKRYLRATNDASRNRNLNRFVQCEGVDRSIGQKRCSRCSTQNLEQYRNIGTREWNVVDGEDVIRKGDIELDVDIGTSRSGITGGCRIGEWLLVFSKRM